MDAGWERRTVAQEPRLGELVKLYEELGFEVRLDPLDPNDPACNDKGCTLCFDDPEVLAATKVIYTRRRQ
ncbi:MAG: hypothetical protein ACYS0K_12920 [Planctomycetota bacterium]